MISLPSAVVRSASRLRLFAVVAAALAVSSPAMAQMSESDAYLRVERLENQLRQLTGTIEALEHRNRQLEQQIKRLRDEIDYRLQQQAGAPTPPPPPAKSATPPMPPVAAASPAEPVAPPSPGRRSDAFDPSANPNAPGVPRALGGGGRYNPVDDPDVGAPGARASGEPIDLSNPAARPVGVPSGNVQAQPSRPADTTPLPPPPPRNVAATGAQPTAPPAQSPKDMFDLGYGYLLRKDYVLAEQTLQDFLRQYPSDPHAADARYWLGESLYQRRSYRAAAESFLAVTTKYDSAAKAPEALLRLGQSLAALKEKEAACAALGEAARKYPRASKAVKQGVEREQKRLGC